MCRLLKIVISTLQCNLHFFFESMYNYQNVYNTSNVRSISYMVRLSAYLFPSINMLNIFSLSHQVVVSVSKKEALTLLPQCFPRMFHFDHKNFNTIWCLSFSTSSIKNKSLRRSHDVKNHHCTTLCKNFVRKFHRINSACIPSSPKMCGIHCLFCVAPTTVFSTLNPDSPCISAWA